MWSDVAQSCPTLCDPMDCSLPGSSIHGIFQARVLDWIAISFSRRSSWLRDWTRVSHSVGRHFTIWATREAAASHRTTRWVEQLSSRRSRNENLHPKPQSQLWHDIQKTASHTRSMHRGSDVPSVFIWREISNICSLDSSSWLYPGCLANPYLLLGIEATPLSSAGSQLRPG